MQGITILIANKNGREAIELCIESIRARTIYAPGYSIRVFDSPGDRLGIDQLRRYRDSGVIELFENDIDFSHGEAVRDLVRDCTTEWAIILDSDTEIISPDWITLLIRKISDENKILAVAHRRPCIVINFDGPELISGTLWLACMLLNVRLYKTIVDKHDFMGDWFPLKDYPWRSQYTPGQMQAGENKFRVETGGWLADRIFHNDVPFQYVETPPELWGSKIIHYGGISRNFFRPDHPLVAPSIAEIHRRLKSLRGG